MQREAIFMNGHFPEDKIGSRYAHFFWKSVRDSIYLSVQEPWTVNVVRHYCFGARGSQATLSPGERASLELAMQAAKFAFVRDWEPYCSPPHADHELRDVLSRSGGDYRIYRMNTREVAQALLDEVKNGGLVFLPPREELRACVQAIEADRAKLRRPPDPPRARSEEPAPAEVLYGRTPRATPKPVLKFIDEDASDTAKALVAKSPGLQGDLKALDDARWTIRYGEPGHGSLANRDRKLITLDGNAKNRHTEFVQTLSHEAGHAMYPYQEDFSSKAAYLRGVMADEGAATMNNIRTQREILANGGWDIGVAGKNHAAYNAAYDASLKDGDAAACRNAIGAVIGNEITSTTGQTYSQYYGGWYDKAFPK